MCKFRRVGFAKQHPSRSTHAFDTDSVLIRYMVFEQLRAESGANTSCDDVVFDEKRHPFKCARCCTGCASRIDRIGFDQRRSIRCAQRIECRIQQRNARKHRFSDVARRAFSGTD